MRLVPPRRRLVAVLCLLACALVTAGGQQAAQAATTTDYASWTFGGTNHAFTGAVGLAAGFPAVSYTSDSSSTTPAPGIASGSTAWLPVGTSFANVFGSSQNQPYLNLRTYGNSAAEPSTTVYRFAEPTPVGTWGVNLGDIDAETLTVSATGVGGAAVSLADLGFGGAYNYCDASPRASTCSGTTAPYPVPTSATTATSVTLTDPDCPRVTANCDTKGEAGFFVPQVPLTSLTVTSTWKQGSPSYQTWFATLRGTISGSVTDTCGVPAGLRVQLLDSAGTVIESQPVVGGDYSFGALARGLGYTVRVDPATLPADASSSPRTIASLGATATAPDLVVTQARTVSGTVTGDDVDGLTVTLDPVGAGADRTTTTTGGAYSFAAVEPGDYTVTVTPEAGDTVDPADRRVTVACAAVDVPAFAVTAPGATPTTTPPTSPSTTPSSTASSTASTTASSTASATASSTASASATGSGTPTDTLPATATSSGTSVGVAPTGVASTSPGVGGLANTGAATAPLIAVGLVAVVVGLALVLLARRRVRPRRA